MAQPKKQTPRVGLRERKKIRTRQDLLDVAQTLFTEYEFADVTIDQIVELANVSQKTFFNYFQNKSQFLSEYMLEWLKTIGFWSFGDTPVVDCRSAIIPTDAHISLDWIIEHRRILKMAMQYTDFLDFIYKLDEDSSQFDPELHAVIREPRQRRVEQGQAQGLVRRDISAVEVCRLYDSLRVDAVRRWLYLDDADASGELLHERYETHVDALVRGIESRD